MKWRLQASLALIILGAALPARASDGPSTLTVCNHGSATAQVVIAARVGFPVAYAINGYVMAPGDCKIVYDLLRTPAYIGIAILGGPGQWVAGTADTVPDFGTTATSALGAQLFGETPVLTRASAFLCYRGDTTQYQIQRGEAFPTDCSGFHPAGDKGSGSYMPLMTIFQFDPVPSQCSAEFGCMGGYYLNIAPSANSRDVRATAGTKDGASVQASGDNSGPGLCGAVSCWDVFLRALSEASAKRNGVAAPGGARPPESTGATPPAVTVGPDSVATGGFITAPGGSFPPSEIPVVSAARPTATAQLVFGGEIHLADGGWRDADGTRLRGSLLDFGTGIPPLRSARRQYSATQEPVSRRLESIRYVFRDLQACTEYTDSTKTEVVSSVLSVAFDLDDYGVVETTTTESRPPSTTVINVRRGAALANLDLAHAEIDDRGCVVLSIPCKKDVCARSTRPDDDVGSSWLTFRLNTKSQGTSILNALKEWAPLYPDGGSPDRR